MRRKLQWPNWVFTFLIFINNNHKPENLFSPKFVKGQELWNVIFLLHSCGRNLPQAIHPLLLCCFLTCQMLGFREGNVEFN